MRGVHLRNLIGVIGFSFALILCLWGNAAFAQEKGLALEVVLDSSGSMVDNDPNRLSIFAGMIFLDVLSDHTTVGIETMRRGRYTLSDYQAAGAARSTARKALSELRFDGGTDCAGPLGLAAKKLSSDPNTKALLFLSDGMCPIRPEQVEALDKAVSDLKAAGIQVFSVGLFDDAATANEDPERDLKLLASATNGEYFRAKKAADLPGIFATILARLVGSEATPLVVSESKIKADVDSYVLDASLILTSDRPIRVTRAVGPDAKSLALPLGRAPFETQDDHYYLSTQSVGSAHYTVIRLQNPTAGEWEFLVDSAGQVNGLLIQNYGLNPRLYAASAGADTLELKDSGIPKFGAQEIEVGMVLLDQKGAQIQDQEFLKRVVATLEATGPDGKSIALSPQLGTDGRLKASQVFSSEGIWTLNGRARMKSGLNKGAESRSFEITRVDLKVANADAIDFGEVKAGELSGEREIDLNGSTILNSSELEILTGESGLSLEPSRAQIAPENLKFNIRLKISKAHEGGEVQSTLSIGLLGAHSGPAKVEIPFSVRIVPLTFWERWGDLIIQILAAALAILILIFLIHGFLSPYDFPPDARINWGNSLDRLDKNRSVIREIAGARRGFRRNAQLRIGGPKSFLASGAEAAVIEAVGENQMVIRASEGAELKKVNKFDPKKETVVEGGTTGLHAGEIYKVGELFFRVQ